MPFEPRTYRRIIDPGALTCFQVAIQETDLWVCAERDLTSETEDLVVRARWDLEQFILQQPRFGETYAPYEVPDSAPEIVQSMARAGYRASVGPMAAVAGAVAEYVARGLTAFSSEVVVENGGDIYICGQADRVVALYAGEDSPVSGHVGLRIPHGLYPVAVCTSSGKVGHSMSFGRADAVTVIAHDGALADAVATALANRVRKPEDIESAVDAARNVLGVLGVLVTVGGHIGAWGNVHLTALE